MKAGGTTAPDKRDFGFDLHPPTLAGQSSSMILRPTFVELEVLDALIECTAQMARRPSAAGPTCVAIPGMLMPETLAAGDGAPRGTRMYASRLLG